MESPFGDTQTHTLHDIRSTTGGGVSREDGKVVSYTPCHAGYRSSILSTETTTGMVQSLESGQTA